MQSTVKWFDPKKGYGFIHHPEGADDIFVHYTSIDSDAAFRALHPEEPVTFELEDGARGLHARHVVSLAPAAAVAAPGERFQAPRADEGRSGEAPLSMAPTAFQTQAPRHA